MQTDSKLSWKRPHRLVLPPPSLSPFPSPCSFLPPESRTYRPSVRQRRLFSCCFVTKKKIQKLQSVQCSKKKATIPVQPNAFHLLKYTLCLYGNSAAPTHSPLVSSVKWDPIANMQHSQKRECSLILVLTVPN